jgi:glycosyltransferase involved in cell wall biosynthesis
LIVGGAERQWSLLIPRLRPRFEVGVLTLVGEGPFFDQLRQEDVPVVCAQMRRRTDVRGWLRALHSSRFRPDLVVTQSINADVVGNVIASRAGAAHLVNAHFNVGPGAPTSRYRDLLARLVAIRADGVIAVTSAQIPRLLGLGYRPETIRIVANGVPNPTPAEQPHAVREALAIAPDDFMVLLVATLRPEKNPDLFVRAVRQANAADPRVRGVVAGGGSELGRVREIAGEDGVIQALGQRQDADDLLAAADVVSLSSDAEGVPMALLEAMALGKPVVATDVGGVSEAVDHGATGLVVPAGDPDAFADALLRLAGDRERARQMGKRAQARYQERFGVERMVDEYARVFDEVLALSGRRSRG